MGHCTQAYMHSCVFIYVHVLSQWQAYWVHVITECANAHLRVYTCVCTCVCVDVCNQCAKCMFNLCMCLRLLHAYIQLSQTSQPPQCVQEAVMLCRFTRVCDECVCRLQAIICVCMCMCFCHLPLKFCVYVHIITHMCLYACVFFFSCGVYIHVCTF